MYPSHDKIFEQKQQKQHLSVKSVVKSLKMPSQWKELLDKMKKKSTVFRKSTAQTSSCSKKFTMAKHKYFQCLPKLCERAVFRMDKEKQQNPVDSSKGEQRAIAYAGDIYC